MICNPCKEKKHKKCKKRNKGKQPGDCDCQHRKEKKGQPHVASPPGTAGNSAGS